LFAIIVGTLIWLFSRSADVTALPSTHPVFGPIYETSAMDVMEMPQIQGPTGLPPRTPVYLNVGPGLLEWSAADTRARKQSGYLYFWNPMSSLKRSNVWSFAACKQSSLGDLTEQDLKADFCEADEMEKGRAAFGTNWVQNGKRGKAILVSEGQVILARHPTNPSKLYALELTEQKRGNLRVRYLEVGR